MNWDGVLDRLHQAGLHPSEETYMENYGKVLAAQRPELRGRSFRCTYGVVHVDHLRMEVLLFPSEGQAKEFIEVAGDDPWWVLHENGVVHFPVCDPEILDRVIRALRNLGTEG